MSYNSTPQDRRRAHLLGISYVLLAIVLAVMLFKIWPPVPWPSDKDLVDNPAVAKALTEALAECKCGSPTPIPNPTPSPNVFETGSPTTPARHRQLRL